MLKSLLVEILDNRFFAHPAGEGPLPSGMNPCRGVETGVMQGGRSGLQP